MRLVQRLSVATLSTISCLLLLVAWSAGPAMAAQDAINCPADRINSNGNICTASDVQLATAAVAVSQTGLTCSPGDDIEVAIAGNVNLRKGNRFDIGVWVSKDGKPMDLRGGTLGAPDEGGAQSCEVVPLASQLVSKDDDPAVFIIDSLDSAATPQDCYDTQAENNGDVSSGFVLTSNRDSIISGQVDVNDDGVIDASDDTTADPVPEVFGAQIVAGGVDIDNNGVIDASDDGIWNGFAVENGIIDVDGDGVFGANDGTDDSDQNFNDFITMRCVAGPTGKLALETLVSWHIPAEADNVCNPRVPDTYGPLQSSKCSVNSSEVEVDIVGKLTIGKVATPDDDSLFEFTYTNDSPPLADQDPDDQIPNISPISPFNLGHLDVEEIYAEIGTGPATIVITETNIPTGWDFSDLTCSGDETVATVIDLANMTATVTLQYNDQNPAASQADVLCSFVNKTLPSLTVVKNTAGGNGVFSFTASAPINAFDLDTGTANTAFRTFTNLQPGVDYSVVELIPAGWTLSSASCSNGSGTLNPDPDIGAISGISLQLGENVTCTFNNTRTGAVSITKNTVGGDDTFDFRPGVGSPILFSLTTSGGSSPPWAARFAAGTYTIIEDAKAGWDLTDLSCTEDMTQDSTTDLPTRTITLRVQDGETINCTVENEKHGTLTVVKQTLPDGDPASFTFTGTVAGSISDGENLTFTGPAGVFTTNESALAGWDLTDIACFGATNSTILIGGTADFVDGDTDVSADVAAGEVINCVYQNTKRSSLTIVKHLTAVGPAVQDFDFTSDIPGHEAFTLSPLDAATDDELEVLDLEPGLYAVSEADATLDGWALINASCSDGSPVSGILVNPGETLTCTFNNAPLGSTTIVKNSVGGNGQFDFSWGTIANANVPVGEAASFSLTTPGPTSTRDYTNKLLINDAYDLTETDSPAPVGPFLHTWNLSDTTCIDASGDTTFNPGENGADATIIADSVETVACTFTNTLDGTLVIRKQTIPDQNAQSFAFTGTTPGLTGSLQDYDIASAELSHTGQPGIYESTETVPAGWALTDISCTGATNSTVLIGGTADFVANDTDVSVDVAAGETVICTFTNTMQGSLTIIKDTVGDEGTFTFNHTVPNVATPFNIDTSVDDTRIISMTLLPGSYMVSEVVPSNWDLSNIACVGQTDSTITIGGAGGFDPGDNAVTVDLLNGEDIVCTFTNTVITSQVTLQKAWVGGVVADTAALQAMGVNGTQSATSTATGGDQTDTTNTAVLTARAGETIDLAEVLGVGNLGDYSTGFSCTTTVNAPSYTPGATTATLLVDEADTDITCTFTNTVNTAQLTLQKAWVGGVAGDTASMTASGINGPQMATSTATGGDQTDTTNTAVLTALVGETVTLGEVLGGVGDYATGFACTGASNQPTALNATTATLLIDAADTAISCTFTNTINTAQLTLQKAWIGGVAGDTAQLSAVGTLATETATSTATGGDQTDTTNTAVLTGLVGETITFTEVLAGTGEYTSSFNCTGATNTPSYIAGATTATLLIDVADTAVTCTFSNRVKVAGLTLQKSWVGGVANDTADLSIVATEGSALATSTAIGGDQTDLVNTALLPSVLVGETVVMSEVLTGTGVYATGFNCIGSTNAPTYTPGATTATLLIDEGDTSVTCTFTNTIETARVELQKAWVGGVANDTAALTIAGVNGPAMATSVAIGGDQTDTGNTAVLTALVGETITLSEVLGGVGDYTSDFSCSSVNAPVYTAGATSATLLIDENDSAITCAYSNTINTAQLTLQKAWVGGVADDTAALTVRGMNGVQMATSTATGGDQTDSTNTAVLTALVGETVTLDEVLGGLGDYTTGFVCAGAANTPDYTAGDRSAALVIGAADTAITCTYTNTRIEPVINLAKTVNGPAILEADGTYTAVYTITASNTGGYGTYDVVDTFSPGTGIALVTDASYPAFVYSGGETQTGTLATPPLANGGTWVTLEGLADGASERWTVTASFTVDPAMVDPVDSQCDPATPVINTGFYNAVAGSSTDNDPTDNDTCTDLPGAGINLAKTVNGPVTLEDDGTYTVVYTITATNTGGPGVYDLVDTFSPGSGITLNTADAVYVAGTENSQNGTLAAYPNFVAGEGLADGLNESWTVTANFTVDSAMVDPDDSQCDPVTPVINTGFYNAVEGSDTDTDPTDNDTCTGLPSATLTVVKNVVGGTALPSDFVLTLTGIDGTHDDGMDYISGDQPAVQVGVEYTLSEMADQVPDYVDSGVSCVDDADDTPVAHPVSLNAGQSVSCTQTNTFRTPPPVNVMDVPVNDKLALLLMILMLMVTGWYFRPMTVRRF